MIIYKIDLNPFLSIWKVAFIIIVLSLSKV